jgi:hypothetical protein
VVGFAAIPFAAVGLALGYTHVYFVRYSLPMVIGVSGLLMLLYADASKAPSRIGTAALLIFLAFLAPSLLRTSLAYLKHRQSLAETWNDNPVISAASKLDLPLAIANGGHVLEFNFYARPELLSRIVYLTNSEAAIRHTGTNIFELTYPLIRPWFPLRVNIEAYDSFHEHHENFLVYSDMNGRVEWLPKELIDSGANLRLLVQSGSDSLYEVTLR